MMTTPHLAASISATEGQAVPHSVSRDERRERRCREMAVSSPFTSPVTSASAIEFPDTGLELPLWHALCLSLHADVIVTRPGSADPIRKYRASAPGLAYELHLI